MNIVTDVILPLALAFIMFALGLGLTGADFLRVVKQPRDFFVGTFSQIILLPISSFKINSCLFFLFFFDCFFSNFFIIGLRPNCQASRVY